MGGISAHWGRRQSRVARLKRPKKWMNWYKEKLDEIDVPSVNNWISLLFLFQFQFWHLNFKSKYYFGTFIIIESLDHYLNLVCHSLWGKKKRKKAEKAAAKGKGKGKGKGKKGKAKSKTIASADDEGSRRKSKKTENESWWSIAWWWNWRGCCGSRIIWCLRATTDATGARATIIDATGATTSTSTTSSWFRRRAISIGSGIIIL